MSELYNYGKEIYAEVLAGSSINNACEDARVMSKKLKRDVCFNFNGYHISTSMGTEEEMVERYYHKLNRGKR